MPFYNFSISTVQGHAGKLVFGYLASKPVMCMQGRLHYYEGHHLWQVIVYCICTKCLYEYNIWNLFTDKGHCAIATSGLNNESVVYVCTSYAHCMQIRTAFNIQCIRSVSGQR